MPKVDRAYYLARMCGQHKGVDGKWTFRLSCRITERDKIAELRREAIDRANRMGAGAPAEGSVALLVDAWLERQKACPPTRPAGAPRAR